MRQDPFALIGRVIADKYSVEELLGEGGYGVVYGGKHLLLDETVAIKCMKPLGATAEDQARATELFLREARVLFNLSHPGIVRMYDVGTLHDEGRNVPYVVLERLRGPSLEGLIKSGRAQFEREEIEWMFERILDALAFAHEHGVVHRDMKPSNIMLVGPHREGAPADTMRKERIKLLDFGVARWANEQRPPSGMTGFTPAYAAPEQWDDDASLVGPPADVFALGVILAEICTLTPVFAHSSPARILRAVIDPSRRIEVLKTRPDLPAGLDALLARATDIDPDVRHADARAFLEDFRGVFALKGDLSASIPRGLVVSVSPPPSASPTFETDPTELASKKSAPDTVSPASRTLGDARRQRSGPREVEMEPAPSRVIAPRRGPLPVLIAVAAVAGGAAVWMLRPSTPSVPPLPVVAAPPPAPSAPATAASSAHAATPFPDAHVDIHAFTAGKDYTSAQLDKAFGVEAAPIEACYRDALGRDERISGRVLSVVAIDSSGHVFGQAPLDDPLWVDNVVRDEALRLCARDHVVRASLPPPAKPDLFTVTLVMQFNRRAPDPKPLEPALAGRFTSHFGNKKTGKFYDPTDATLVRVGDVLSLDYPDGALGCVSYSEDKSLACRWIQTDYRGSATVAPTRAGGYEGTWGYQPSDSDGGAWKLEPRRP